MATPYVLVDAFTDTAFGGNPAIVVRLPAPTTEAWMQSIAAEVNLSETAFVYPAGDAFGLRWFTPTVEIDLCGHATLATAHVLFEEGVLAHDAPASFDTRAGRLTVRRDGERLLMDFPTNPVTRVDTTPLLERSVGVPIVAAGLAEDGAFLLAEVATADEVRDLRPDLGAIATLPDVIGLIVTAPGTDGVDFVSRSFLPQWGIDEDPVTGAAHCILAPYWAERVGRDTMVGAQLSPRGGVVEVELRGDRTVLVGRATTVARGEFLV